MENVWIEIPGYGGRYVVSGSGDVKSLFSISKLGKVRYREIILKQGVSTRGYKVVGLQWAGIDKQVKVHRLVCAAFHENPENKPQVNHKDLNPLNNFWWNLEWCTGKENTLHAQLNGRIPTKKPKYVPPADYRYKKVVDTRNREEMSTAELAKRLGWSLKKVCRVLRGERYNDTPYRYVGMEDLIKPKLVIEPIKKPIGVFDLNWNHIRDFEDISEAVVFANANWDGVRDFLNGEKSQSHGYKYKLIDLDGNYIEPKQWVSKKPPLKPKKEKLPVTPSKIVVKFDLNGNIIETYESIRGAARTIGVDHRNLRKQILKSPRNYYNGFIYKIG